MCTEIFQQTVREKGTRSYSPKNGVDNDTTVNMQHIEKGDLNSLAWAGSRDGRGDIIIHGPPTNNSRKLVPEA